MISKKFFFFENLPCDIYIFEDTQYLLYGQKDDALNKSILKEMIIGGHVKFFTYSLDKKIMIEEHQNYLRVITRSFSMGNILKNCKKQISLLMLNMEYLYEDPTNDGSLGLQYQSIVVMFKFLYENPKYHKEIYEYIKKQRYHFILEQPFLSSLFFNRSFEKFECIFRK